MRELNFFAILIFIAMMGFGSGLKAQTHEKSLDQYVTGYNRPVRGVWLTNVDSRALYSHGHIKRAVHRCDQWGINTIFAVVWNKGMTTYRSQVMKELTGVAIDPRLDSADPGRDPLKELIAEAHQHNMKVFAWFEFGFAASYQAQGGEILKKKPGWALKNAQGELVTKNGFEWMNPLDPKVQDFMLSLIGEVVRNYDVDGIQGDDRLPAMPVEGGYNQEIVRAYRQAHHGQDPPDDYNDFRWVHWRAEQLTSFMKALYQHVKSIDSECIVSMAPSVYPWSKAEYLQDWPRWVNAGYVDMVCPQVYRKDSAYYRQTLKKTRQYIRPGKRHLLYPGILIKSGNYRASPDFFRHMIRQNRQHNIPGEVFFFYEGLSDYSKYLKTNYKITN